MGDAQDKPNIYQRINAIQKEVDYIRKDKKVESYMAVTHDAVTSETRGLFVKHGVVIVPHEVSSVVADTGTTTSKGTPFIRFEAKYSIDFVNADDGADKATVDLTAHALDHGDKAPGKALSYAVKYAILKLLSLETGEDEEGRQEQKRATAPKEKKTLTPASKQAWENAKAAYIRDGNLDAVLSRVDISEEHQKRLVSECSATGGAE